MGQRNFGVRQLPRIVTSAPVVWSLDERRARNALRGQDLIADIERLLHEEEPWEIRHPLWALAAYCCLFTSAMAVIYAVLLFGWGMGL